MTDGREYTLTEQRLKRLITETVREYIRESGKAQGYGAKEIKDMLNGYRTLKTRLKGVPICGIVSGQELLLRAISKKGERGREAEKSENPHDALKSECEALTRIERATDFYRDECVRSGKEEKKRRYREMYYRYMSETPYSVEEIAEAEKVSTKTVYKDLKIVYREMSEYC